MKKLFIMLIFSAVLFIGLPYFKVSAMPVTYDIPFSAVPDAISMFYDILNGGTINTSGISDINELIETYKAENDSARSFLQPFLTQIWNKMARMALDGEQSLTETSDFVIPVSVSDMAYAMGYNIKWWEKYQNTDIPVATPDVTFLDEIAYINERDSTTKNSFFFYNYPVMGYEGFNTSNNNFAATSLVSPYTAYTWVFEGDIILSINQGNRQTPNAFPVSLADIYITSNNGVYSFSNTFSLDRCWIYNNGAVYDWQRAILFGYPGGNRSGMTGYQSYNSSSITISKSGTLQECFDYLKQKVKNVNIYVDGVLYAYAGDIPQDFITAPDVVNVGDTDRLTYDVFFPKIEGLEGLSISEFLKWLEGQLNDGIDSVGLQDLIDDAVPVVVIDDDADADTTPTVAPIVTTAPVEEIIDPTADPDDPDTTPTPSPYPLPPLPKFTFDNIPHEVNHTVLAEIVDSTQKVIPEDLMTLIWSTFGLLVVGGLIYILHK